MGRKSELKRLAEAVRQAEAELDAATKRSDLNLAAKKLMQARQALKAAEKAAGGATRPAACGGAARAGAS
jgi:hypothetical protein